VLTGCLGVTAVLWHSATADAEQEAQADFDGRVRELVNNLDQRMQTYVQVLYGVQGLFASSEHVTAMNSRPISGQDLNHHFPGVHGVGYIQLVGPQQAEEHEAMVRRGGFPATACSRRPRAWYAPIVYLEPFNENNRWRSASTPHPSRAAAPRWSRRAIPASRP
jgi:CHASE1-domain containing sensor protein